MHGRDLPIALVGGKEPRLLQPWNGPAERSSHVCEIKIGIRVLALKWSRRKFPLAGKIGQGPRSQCRVAVVVEDRTVISRTPTLRVYADIGNATVFCAEIVGQHIDFTHGF